MNKNYHSLSRRSFIKSGLALTSLPFIHSSSLFAYENSAEVKDNLFDLFKNPPVTAKPFVRWWWNGNKLTGKEILRELDIMHEAGIGGVEINPIAFPGGDDLGIPSLRWLSPEWIEMVKVALKGAEERGMVCDIIVGSGWPFGGEFLKTEERSQLMTIVGYHVNGGGVKSIPNEEIFKEAAPVIHSPYNNPLYEVYSAYLAPMKLDHFIAPEEIPVDTKADVQKFEIPEGEYILYVLVKVSGFQAVINGSPGAAGPVLNHFDRDAVQTFLNRMSDNLFPELKGLKGFRAMFCDSMELEGANWCKDFKEQYIQRRGYDVTPYLPFILYKVGHMGHAVEGGAATELTGSAKEEVARVKYDFYVTCMEIIRDNFVKPYTAWCNEHGFQSRMQPYGREFHPLEGSFNVDIPECETWLFQGGTDEERPFTGRTAYTNVNKFVASATRLSGKKIISCEEVTNTNDVFNTPLQTVKLGGDQSNLSGVTHSILHGFNYSPVEAPFPGWVRYGTFFNERNTWWPFFKFWSAYKARLSVLLQETEPYADIAVMHPLADMWTIHGPQRDPFPALHYPPYQYRVWEAIHQNGCSCDYTCESVIQQSEMRDGYLRYHSRKYHTLILIEVESMEPETARALERFMAGGGKLILIAKEPHKSPGLKDYTQRDKEVKDIVSSMKQHYASRIFLIPAPEGDMHAWFTIVQQRCGLKPYVKMEKPDPFISQIRHTGEGKDIFFFTNSHISKSFPVTFTFPDKGMTPWWWNPETGERFICPAVSKGGSISVSFEMEPAGSKLLVFERYDKGKKIPVSPQERPDYKELKNWKVRMEHINGDTEVRTIEEMVDWSKQEDTRSFAGNLFYEKKIEGTVSPYSYIDLGLVVGISEVILGGEKLGTKWYGRHLYRIPAHLSRKSNLTLQVKIITTVGNYLKASKENQIGQNWTRGQQWHRMGMLGPVKLL